MYEGFSFIVCLMIVTLMLIATFFSAHYRSSTGDSVNLLSRTICTIVVVSDWCITNLAHG